MKLKSILSICDHISFGTLAKKRGILLSKDLLPYIIKLFLERSLTNHELCLIHIFSITGIKFKLTIVSVVLEILIPK